MNISNLKSNASIRSLLLAAAAVAMAAERRHPRGQQFLAGARTGEVGVVRQVRYCPSARFMNILALRILTTLPPALLAAGNQPVKAPEMTAVAFKDPPIQYRLRGRVEWLFEPDLPVAAVGEHA